MFKNVVLLIAFSLIVGCSPIVDESNVEDVSREVIELLVHAEYEKVFKQFFTDDLKDSLSLSDFKQMWQVRVDSSGEYSEIGPVEVSKRGEAYHVAETELEYAKLIFPIRMIFDDDKQLVSFHIGEGLVNYTLPETLIEEDVIVGKGSQYELGGTLTLPKQFDEPLPAVVLVHGSGPRDRDSVIFSNKPFRDIAWGISQGGMAVLRYDKRTYTHGETMSQEEVNELTVHEETVEDAILAAEVIKDDSRIDADRVFVIGHSLGGMLAPRIDAVGGDFAGIIIMAGSPRHLWEIIYDQNIALLESVNEPERAEMLKKIEEEYEKAKKINHVSADQIMDDTIFGVPTHYFVDMASYDTKKLLSELDKPILVLQGEDDFQVSLEKDYAMYKELLKERENVTFIRYPGLNHLFIHYEGVDKGTVAEYQQPGLVDEKVISDVVNWLLDQIQ